MFGNFKEDNVKEEKYSGRHKGWETITAHHHNKYVGWIVIEIVQSSCLFSS